MKRCVPVVLMALVGALYAAPPQDLPRGPGPDQNLKLKAPVSRWDDALPLGNGLMGGLLWGEGSTLRLSLDRGDLWDERTHGEKRWWAKYTYARGREMIDSGKAGTVNGWWDHPYNGVTPTKLPAGRLQINLPDTMEVESFELNLASAEGWVHLTDQSKVSAFFSADQHVALIRIPGNEPVSCELIPSGATPAGNNGPSSGGAVKKLGYPDAQHGHENSAKWYVQDAVDGFQYCICVQSRKTKSETLLSIAVTSTNDDADPLALARKRCRDALHKGYAAMLAPHTDWWKTFWAQSAISLPAIDAHILKQYYLVQYFHGAASRRGAPPMPLQGVWTADNGGLPPWKGDYHNDLNTQMTYIAYQCAGHFNEGLSYLDFLWDRRQIFQDFAREFYGTKGLACPGVMSLAGQPLGGWGQYSMSPTMSAWSAHLFYLHWRYTMDDQFLRERAYPWVSGVGECMLGLLEPNKDGILVLPLSSSPEIFNNSARAWLEPNSNYDLMCLKMLFYSLQEMADASGKKTDAKRWGQAAHDLGDYHVDDSGMLLINRTEPLPGSHRHLSNLMGLHPFNLITVDGGDEDITRIDATLKDWKSKGTGAWTGYSFSWFSCLLARVGKAEDALRYLDIYASAFVTRNGFHVNGDQTKSGFSGFTYRPFTLEGNFLAAQAVQEMMVQSWSALPGQRDTEVIRVFPAMPWRWHDAAFRDLRVEGGHRVSAVRKNNATVWLRVVAGHDAMVRIRDNFGGHTPQWNLAQVKKDGPNYVVALTKGQTLEARLSSPEKVPDAPAHLAEKVEVSSSASIKATKLPVRIGADSRGGSRFEGDIARVLIVNRVLDAKEISRLADQGDAGWSRVPDAVVVLGGCRLPGPEMETPPKILPADGGLDGALFRFDGKGYLEVPHDKRLDCRQALTLSAWIRPSVAAGSGARIIDKSPVGGSSGYLLDTWPGGKSIRLITREPALVVENVLPLNEWSHVAATVDGKSGKQVLYLNGDKIAESD